ncbi:clathrin heavy chain linker domain-containing protein 1 [Cariama cristata]
MHLTRRLKALESESTTLLHCRKRAMELEDKCFNSCLIFIWKLPMIHIMSYMFFSFLFPSFSELLESRQYDAAATYAVNSPKGILCNEEALKEISSFKYFDTLINSSTAAGHLPNSAITLETIKCALSEKQLNLVTHWVKQQRLTFSEVDTIYDYGKVEPSNKSKCLALAQVMYGQSCAHREVALCLCKQAQISGAVDYIQQLEHFSLCKSGSTCMETTVFIYGATILSFISADHKKHGLELLEEMSKKRFIIRLEKQCIGTGYSTDGIILEDWNKIEVACAENEHGKLSQKIVSILTPQDGVFENWPLADEQDARIMARGFW